MNYKYILLFLLGCSFSKMSAQDPVFTQYFLIPESLNPGFSGFLETTYVGVIHRTQWPALDLRVDTEYGFVNTWLPTVHSGVGVSVLNHRENGSGYSLSEVMANYAYRVQISDNWYFRPAIEIGFGQKSFGFQNLLLQDQINVFSGTINPNSLDTAILKDKVNYFDFTAGMVLQNDEAWVGLSLKHLNRPDISFTEEGNVPLNMFLSLSAGYEFLIADYIDIRTFPFKTKMLITSNYMQQGAYNRLDIGASLLFQKIFLGATAVTNPSKNDQSSQLLTSVNLFTGLQLDSFRLGLSYDLNTTQIGRTGGIYELSLTYQFNMDSRCFGCPNYLVK
ncbi:PorP/SprF family type IX secretion system membrane protein [Leeuwenhoekiella sp. A16]|uniref:PorP/SprF family type IX secretion system membrane protein n=1 Tax=unclassified Leeuwenhoekiella TaxID=2615029 RepID=UPI003A7F8D5E